MDSTETTLHDRASAPADAGAHETPTDGLREKVGALVGATWAPFIGFVAKLRKARFFHAEGQLFRASFEAAPDGPYAEVAQRLGRTVLARLSTALWTRGKEWPDVLGIGLRFHRGAKLGVKVQPADQDILFATVRSPLLLGVSPFTTHQHDFLANRYYAVSPFELGGGRRVELRLTPLPHEQREGSRAERIGAAVEANQAVFALEFRKTLSMTWHEVGKLRLEKSIDLDQETLRFDPFQAGAGISPVGAIHAIRRAVYAASQRMRPAE